MSARGIFALSGGAAYSNNLTIDGFDNNDDRLAQDRFQLPFDSVAEVQVISNQFSAEYGRASGGRVNQRTRSGGKKFRGRAFMFYRNSDYDANTYNNNRRGLAKLPTVDYDPGFSVGGPIPFSYFKNRTFFFTSYEYDNLYDTALIDTLTPVQGSQFYSLPAPTGSNQRTEATTQPTTGLSPALLAPYVQSVSTPSRSHKYFLRLDHNFTENNNFTLSYQLGRLRNSRQYRVPTNTLEEALQGTVRDTDAVNLTHNYIFSPKLINQFRFQYSKFTPDFGSPDPTSPVFLITLNDSLPTGPDRRAGTLIAGNSTAAANGNFSNVRSEKRQQYVETLRFVPNNFYTLTIGADLQAISSQYYALGDATGTYNFQSVADFLANRVIRFRRNFGTNSTTKNTYYGLFVQNDTRLRSNLSVNLGLRYERETVIKDRNNFGPRAAVAYSPFKDGKGVIRAGAAIFYNRALLRTIDDFSLDQSQLNFDSRLIPGPALDVSCFTPPVAGQPATNSGSPRCQFLTALGVNKGVPSIQDLQSSTIPGVSAAFTNATANFARRVDPQLKIPESYQFNIGFEREIGKDFVFETNFTLNRTVRLWREYNINTYKLPAGFVDYNDYLVRGFSSSTLRFVNGDPNDFNGVAPPISGVTTVNLASANNSTAAGSPIALASQALASRPETARRINPNQADIQQVASLGRSDYRGLILELRRRYRNLGAGFGLSARVGYTLSKLTDDGIVNTSDSTFPGDFQREKSRSLLDRRHRFVFSGTFQLPWQLLGLRLSPILRLSSGAPFNLGAGGVDRNLDDVINDRLNFNGNLSDIRFRNPGDPYNAALVSQFSLAPIGARAANLPRNAGVGPGQRIFDINVSREIRISERFRLRPNVEFNNVLNSTTFTFGNDFINFNALVPNPTTPAQIAALATFQQNFLVPQRTLRPRQFRFGLRFDF